MRLRDGVEPMPPMMALGACRRHRFDAACGEQIAFDLRRAGCTLDFAPVIDLALESQNVVIGTRSLGGDARRVAHLWATFRRPWSAPESYPAINIFRDTVRRPSIPTKRCHGLMWQPRRCTRAICFRSPRWQPARRRS